MKKNSNLRRVAAGALAAGLLAVSLCGCTAEQANSSLESIMDKVSQYMPSVPLGETVSPDSKWINSSLEGAFDETVPTNPKDDFYTAINRDWLLEHTATEEEPVPSHFVDNEKMLDDRLLGILRGSPDEAANLTNELPTLSLAQTAHNAELVQRFAALANDSAKREADGVEPARRYVDAVRDIDTLDELTAYLRNEDGSNIALNGFIPFSVKVPYTDRTAYVVQIAATPPLSMGDVDYYRTLDVDAALNKNKLWTQTEYLLARLGWTSQQVKELMIRCLRFEQVLAHNTTIFNGYTDLERLEMIDNSFTPAEVTEMQGSYPLMSILQSCGMDGSDRYVVEQPGYLRALGRLYNDAHLEDMKAYLLVHVVPTLLPLLDEESRLMDIYAGATPPAALPQTPETAADDKEPDDGMKAVLQNYACAYLADPLQQVYLAYYCTEQQKQDTQAIIDELFRAYHTLIESEDWLSEETRTRAIEKLDAMTVRNLYPDYFTDYTGLDLTGANGDSLVDAVAAIRRFERAKMNGFINQPIEATYWDLSLIPTTTANAYYIPTENSINICAGTYANGFFFDAHAPLEQNLARVGAIVGHEISHGFDSQGREYDGAGYKSDWWTPEDLSTFMLRTNRLIKSYNTQYLAPGQPTASYGNTVNTEAVADMAGIKAVLLIAAEHPNFDYDLFFTAFTQNWAETMDLKRMLMLAADPHPRGFLRANRTLQQFDEFIKTYDLQPGDGMYLAPEDRITVW